MEDKGLDTLEAKKLYDAVSKDFDIGTEDEFYSKMQTPEQRASFHKAISQNFDIGDYNSLEDRLKKKAKDFPTTTKNVSPTSNELDGETPSTSKISAYAPEDVRKQEIKQERINAANAKKIDYIKKSFAENLLKTPTKAYKDSYINTLSKFGYNPDELRKFADTVVDTRNEQEKTDDLNAQMEKGAAVQAGEPIVDFFKERGQAAVGGLEKTAEGLGKITGALGFPQFNTKTPIWQQAEEAAKEQEKTPEERALDVVKGGVKTVTGLASAAFNVLPQALVFQAGAEAVKKAAEKSGAPEWVSQAVDLPFTIASTVANKLGYNPQEGSFGRDLLELGDLILMVGAHKAAVKGKKAIANTYEGYKNALKLGAEGELPQIELKDLQDLSKDLQGITLDDIQAEAEKQGRTDIVDKIENAKPIEQLHEEASQLQADLEKKPELEPIIAPKLEQLNNRIDEKDFTEINSQLEDSGIVGEISELEKQKEGVGEETKKLIDNQIASKVEQVKDKTILQPETPIEKVEISEPPTSENVPTENKVTQKQVDEIKYKVTEPKTHTLIKLPIDRVIALHEEHQEPIGRGQNEKSDARIDNAKKHIVDEVNGKNDKPTTATYLAKLSNGNLMIGDGRRRLIAMKELGIKDAWFEVAKEDIENIKNKVEPPTSENGVADKGSVKTPDVSESEMGNEVGGEVQVPKGKGTWREKFNDEKDIATKNQILEVIADSNTSTEKELRDVYEAAKKTETVTDRINWSLANNKNTPKDIFDDIINSKVLEKSASDEAIKTLIDKRNAFSTPKAEVGKEGFTEGKDLNKIFGKAKEKYGDKKGTQYYEAANRLVNPNKNTIIEVRSNGVVVKEGEKYLLKPFTNTDANYKKWELGRPLDVTQQYTSATKAKPEAPINSEKPKALKSESSPKEEKVGTETESSEKTTLEPKKEVNDVDKQQTTSETVSKFDRLDQIAEQFEKGEVTKEVRNERKRIFDENPKIKEVNDNFSKITKQLEEKGELKKSRKDCP